MTKQITIDVDTLGKLMAMAGVSPDEVGLERQPDLQAAHEKATKEGWCPWAALVRSELFDHTEMMREMAEEEGEEYKEDEGLLVDIYETIGGFAWDAVSDNWELALADYKACIESKK